MSAGDETLTLAEVAEIARLSESAVRREIDRGRLRAAKLCGRIRIRRGDYDAWWESCGVAPSGDDELAPLLAAPVPRAVRAPVRRSFRDRVGT